MKQQYDKNKQVKAAQDAAFNLPSTITVNRTEWEAMKRQAAIGKLVLEKFVSGNTIPVSRCTISAEELALLSTDERKENEVNDENDL